MQGLETNSRKQIETPRYADDITMILFGKRSVSTEFDIVYQFQPKTGLKLIENKAQGLALLNSNTSLPNINLKFEQKTLSKKMSETTK